MKSLVLCLLVATAIAAPSKQPQFKRGSSKIVGGEDTTPGEIPWQISLQYYDHWHDRASHFCGGSIYSENWVITSANCIYDENYNEPENLQIAAGDYKLYEDEGHEQTIEVVKIIRHEGFNPFMRENDIALIKLGEPLVFNDFVQPIAIPAVLFEEESGDSLITGWGDTAEHGQQSSILQKITVPIVSDAECATAYADSTNDIVTASMICAGLPEGSNNSCNGDSGGPMVCEVGGKPQLCGITSWGHWCGRPDYPAVYTQVSFFVDWIIYNAV